MIALEYTEYQELVNQFIMGNKKDVVLQLNEDTSNNNWLAFLNYLMCDDTLTEADKLKIMHNVVTIDNALEW